MRKADVPGVRLVLHDIPSEGEETLTIISGSQGEPYRDTLRFSFERNASGDFSRYEHLASVEIEPEEERQLYAMLKARAEARR